MKIVPLFFSSIILSFFTLSAISIENYINIAKEHAFIQNEQLEEAISQQTLNQVKNEYWTLQNQSSIQYRRPVPEGLLFDQNDQQIASNQLNLNRLYKKNGLALDINWSIINTSQKAKEFNDTLINKANETIQNIGVNISYPLGQNRRGVLTQLPEKLATIETKITLLKSYQATESFITGLILEYIHWTYLKEKNTILKKRVFNSKKQLRNSQKKEKLNLIKKIDLLRAKTALKTHQKELKINQTAYDAKKNEFAIHLNNEVFLKKAPQYKLSQFKNYKFKITPPSTSKEIQKINLNKEKLSQKLIAEKNKEKSKLSLNLNTNLLANKNHPFFSNKTYYESRAYINWQKKIKSTHHLIEQEKLKNEIKILENKIKIETNKFKAQQEKIKTQANGLEKTIKLTQEQIKLAKLTLKEEKKRYKTGEVELENVLIAEDLVFQTNLMLLTYLSEYHKLYFQILDIQDQILTIKKL